MADIGKLTPSSPGDLAYLSGHIQTLDRRIAITVEGDPALCDTARPSHRIYTLAPDRSRPEIDAAWLKTCRHGPQAGKQFLSIQIDHPDRPAPLNAAAFLDDKTGEWVIVWQRRRGVQAASGPAM